MEWFLNLKTGQKLAVSFGLCLTLASIVGVTAAGRMAQMNANTRAIVHDSARGLSALV